MEYKEIVIKKSDKGNTLIIIQKEYYRDKLVLNDHLNMDTYCQTDTSADKTVFKELKTLMDK